MNWSFGINKWMLLIWVTLIASALADGFRTGNLWAFTCAAWVFIHIMDTILIERFSKLTTKLLAILDEVTEIAQKRSS